MSSKSDESNADRQRTRGDFIETCGEIEKELRRLGGTGKTMQKLYDSSKDKLLDAHLFLFKVALRYRNPGAHEGAEWLPPSEGDLRKIKDLRELLRNFQPVDPSNNDHPRGESTHRQKDHGDQRRENGPHKRAGTDDRSQTRATFNEGATKPPGATAQAQHTQKSAPSPQRAVRTPRIAAAAAAVFAVVVISKFALGPSVSTDTSAGTAAATSSQPAAPPTTGTALRIATARRNYKAGEAFRFSVASPVPCQLEVYVTDAAGSRDRIVPSFANMDTYPLPGGNRQQPFPDSGGYQITIDDTPGPTQVTATCMAADGTRLSGRADITVVR